LKYEISSKSDKDILWNDDSVKSVIIATPIWSHYAIAKEALLHNKNIFIEKPLSLKKKSGEKLIKLAQKRNLKVAVEYTQTFAPSILKIIEILHKIGKLEFIEMSTKHLGRFMDNNVFWLLASHHMSILDKLLPLDRLSFNKKCYIYENNLCTTGSILFKDDAISGRIDVSTNYPGKEMCFTLYGSLGTIKWNALSKKTIELTLYNRQQNALPDELTEYYDYFEYDESNNLKYSIKYFYDLIHNNASSNVQSALQITKILECLEN